MQKSTSNRKVEVQNFTFNRNVWSAGLHCWTENLKRRSPLRTELWKRRILFKQKIEVQGFSLNRNLEIPDSTGNKNLSARTSEMLKCKTPLRTCTSLCSKCSPTLPNFYLKLSLALQHRCSKWSPALINFCWKWSPAPQPFSVPSGVLHFKIFV